MKPPGIHGSRADDRATRFGAHLPWFVLSKPSEPPLGSRYTSETDADPGWSTFYAAFSYLEKWRYWRLATFSLRFDERFTSVGLTFWRAWDIDRTRTPVDFGRKNNWRGIWLSPAREQK
jgi:hypothetical protein